MIISCFINTLALRFSCISYSGKFNCVRKDKFKMKISEVYFNSVRARRDKCSRSERNRRSILMDYMHTKVIDYFFPQSHKY